MGGSRRLVSRLVVFCLLLVMISSLVVADDREGTIKLLAVAETHDGVVVKGNVAELSLEIIPGEGRVPLETFPLTKVGTQISLRFAKQIACKYVEKDCSGYDFIYSIHSDTGLVSGPSAGAAAAVLTSALLEGYEVREDVALTGTINSGGLIGPVGGLKSKVEGGADHNLSVVLIPYGNMIVEDEENEESDEEDGEDSEEENGEDGESEEGEGEEQGAESEDGAVEEESEGEEGDAISERDEITLPEEIVNESEEEKGLNLSAYGEELNISVQEVSTIGEALYVFTGELIEEENYTITVDEKYESVMGALADKLCERTQEYKERYYNNADAEVGVEDETVNATVTDAENLTNTASRHLLEEAHYSAASFCFRANIAWASLSFLKENVSAEDASGRINELRKVADKLEEEFENKSISTINDLQTYMVVKERISEAREYFNLTEEHINDSTRRFRLLAFSGERLYSAISWSTFFGRDSMEFSMSDEELRKSCEIKIAEAQERHNFVGIYLPNVSNTQKLIMQAEGLLKEEDYPACLFVASKAKAEANAILSTLGVKEEQVENTIEQKLRVTRKVISKAQEHGIFPIVGYSYYEYAQALVEDDKPSALLFSEYALELSNMDIYFEKEEGVFSQEFMLTEEAESVLVLGLGFLLGACLVGVLVLIRGRFGGTERKGRVKKRKR